MKRRELPMVLLACAVVIALAGNAALAAGGAKMPDGHRIINMVDAFLAYYDAAKGGSEADRAARWDAMLEAPYRPFFDQVIYRGLTGDRRKQRKAACLEAFWGDVAKRIDALRKANATGEKRLLEVRKRFTKAFKDFDPKTDFYLTVAMSFVGKVVELDGKPTLAISLDRFTPGDVQLGITIAHEMYHLYHFRTFSTKGAVYRILWAEGLAVYASGQVVPGHRDRFYLGFPIPKMNRCYDLFQALSADLLANLTEPDHAFKRRYFGAEKNDTGVPPEAGYYVGYRLVERLAKKHTAAEMARWTPRQALIAIRPVLADFAGDIKPEQVKALLYPPKEKKGEVPPSPSHPRGEGRGEGASCSDQ